MAQKGKPFVTIEMDEPRRLRFGINALCELEDLLGVSVDQIDEIPLGIRELRKAFYCGLKGGSKELAKDLSLDKVGEMIDSYLDNGGTIEELGEKLKESLSSMFPEASDPASDQEGKN